MSGGALSAQELKDRAAIEAVWVKFLDVTRGILSVPKSERQALLLTVASETEAKVVLEQAATFEKNGWDNYGSVVHHPYWGPSVGGKNAAVMGDCLDSSKAGRKDVKTGQLLTVGVKGDNTRISFTKASNDKWLVFNVQFLVNEDCKP